MTLALTTPNYRSTKKWLALTMLATLLALAAGFTMVSAQPAHAATVTFTVDGITYSADDANSAAGATVTDYDPGVGGHDAVIPATVTHSSTTYSVTIIGTRAFENNALTSVDIPNSVITIGNNAFHGNALTHVTIPDSVTTIDDWAFYVNDLTSVTIGNSVTTIGSNAFYGNDLTSVVFPDSLTTIGNNAFYGNDLTSVVIPNSVTTIGMQAFYNNDLSSVIIGESVTTIGMLAFDGNSPLTGVVFEGDAPTMAAVAGIGPFGEPDGQVLYFYSGATGFSTPEWHGYPTLMDPYIVAFDANGGAEPMQLQIANAPAGLIANTFTRDGSEFIGWNTSSDGTGDTYADGANYSFTADITLYAQWDVDTYVVTFDSGDGTDVDPATVEHGQALTTPVNPAREGYTFTGWYTDADTTTAFELDSAITGDLTLYAGWNINTYTVTFDTSEGTAIASTIVEHGQVLTVPTNPTRNGYTFTGWYTNLDATTSFEFTTTVTEDLTLYAGWDINTYTVTFDTGDGTAIASTIVEQGQLLTAPTNPTLEGHTFTGWYTDPDATTSFDFTTTATEDLTLYAGWQPVTVPVVSEDTPSADVAVADELAATGDAANLPALLVALLAIVAGAGLLSYRRWDRRSA